MELLLGTLTAFLRHLAGVTVFYLIGSLLLKLLTLGRYPRLLPLRGPHWRAQAQDVELVSCFGLLATVALVIGIASLAA